jgi:hypothetical protein
MIADRPTISPELIAAMIESTPDRVRRRLDQTPDAAAAWNWIADESTWSVDAGGESVTLPQGHVNGVEQLRCTCLLSPRCFHVIACLIHLKVALIDDPGAEEKEESAATIENSTEDPVEPDDHQKHATRELLASVAQLLRVGVSSGGVVVQSRLLRAVHQCRAEGLHRLASLGVRVIAGTGEIRTNALNADPDQLAEVVADVLETCLHLLGEGSISPFWIGSARRKQRPVRPRKLLGLFAEPIITRSGFAGATAYFLGEDDRIYTAADVRPGDVQHALDAYLGGIEIGPVIRSVKQLARGLYLGTDLTASRDGRLGRGKSIRIAEQGPSSWQVEAIGERFRRPLTDQWNAAYDQAALPDDARPAGWDFIFLEGTVLGATGAELLFRSNAQDQPIRFLIENENESLHYRMNMRMLSHAPGLRLHVIARVNLLQSWTVAPLAIAPMGDALQADDEPRLEIPESWGGRTCLGFDEIERHFLVNARASPVVLNVLEPRLHDNPLSALHRRWVATMRSGVASQIPRNSNRLAKEMVELHLLGFGTGASLLDELTRATSGGGPSSVDTFLATALYLRASAYEWTRSRAALTV